MLRVRDLRAGYHKVEVLHGISFEVREKECVALVGANGAGKTTALRAVCGLIPPRSGSIDFRGVAIGGKPGHAIARLGISMCPEGRQVFAEMTVQENLDIGAYGRSDREVGRDLEEMIALFPILGRRRKQAAGTLSGGEQEMLAIARTLMARPALCIFDEPSLGLAPKIVEEVERVIGLVKARGVTTLLVEQNAAMALRLADRAYVLEAGTIRVEGAAADLVHNPEISAAYLGF